MCSYGKGKRLRMGIRAKQAKVQNHWNKRSLEIRSGGQASESKAIECCPSFVRERLSSFREQIRQRLHHGQIKCERNQRLIS